MKKLIFELEDVWYSYLSKFPALCGVDLKIGEGEKIAIVGANGTGKTTLLQLLDGLIFPDKGVIRAFGNRLNEELFSEPDLARNFRKKVGFVFQNADVQLFCPTVKEDIIFGPLQLGVGHEETIKRLKDISEQLNIAHLIERSPHQLSVGEKRKVAIATTLAVSGEVLILDEPTAGLDPKTTRHIVDIILQANKNGATIITATHDLHIIEEIADTIYCLGSNRNIARSGASKDLLKDKTFLEENNLVHVHRHAHADAIHTHEHEHIDHHH
ncbi:MAG: ABC transporter ATP-binding protein [Candidatus Omnitrophota bacterium]